MVPIVLTFAVIVVQFATFNALSSAPFMILDAVVARGRLGGATASGTILSFLGVGSVIGAPASARVRPRRPLVVATVGAGGCQKIGAFTGHTRDGHTIRGPTPFNARSTAADQPVGHAHAHREQEVHAE